MDKNKKVTPVRKYLLGVALALDQLGAAFRGWDHDETISSMYGKMKIYYGKDFKKKRPLAYRIAKILDRIDENHCEGAIEYDEGKNSVVDHEIANGGTDASRQ